MDINDNLVLIVCFLFLLMILKNKCMSYEPFSSPSHVPTPSLFPSPSPDVRCWDYLDSLKDYNTGDKCEPGTKKCEVCVVDRPNGQNLARKVGCSSPDILEWCNHDGP